MNVIARARTSEELRALNNEIHDLWFHLERIKYDQDAGLLEIAFAGRGQKRWFEDYADRGVPGRGAPTRVLSVHAARRFHLLDTEHVGKYDFNELVFDPAKGVLTVKTGVPLQFTVAVDELDVRLYESQDAWVE